MFVFKLPFSHSKRSRLLLQAFQAWWLGGGLAVGWSVACLAEQSRVRLLLDIKPREKSQPEERVLFRAEKLGHV